MFNPRWLHSSTESKIVTSEEEYERLWASGWRGSPADVQDPKMAYLEFLDEIAAIPAEEPEVIPEPVVIPPPIPDPGPPLPFKRGPGRPVRRY